MLKKRVKFSPRLPEANRKPVHAQTGQITLWGLRSVSGSKLFSRSSLAAAGVILNLLRENSFKKDASTDVHAQIHKVLHFNEPSSTSTYIEGFQIMRADKIISIVMYTCNEG